MPTILRTVDASKHQPKGPELFGRIDLTIASGESVALQGRSGSGKTTLLNCLGLLDQFDSGSLELLGEEVGSLSPFQVDALRAQAVGFVFQRFFLIPHLNALDNVKSAFVHLPRRARQVAHKRSLEALDVLGIADLARRRPRELSGGEQQRVAIARAIAKGPKLVLADEPTGSLDESTGQTVVDILLRRVRESGASLLMVTHDRSLTKSFDRSLSIQDHRLVPNELEA